MKILHVFRTPVGGLFRHVCDLAAEQKARGHEVGVIHDSSTGDGLASARLQALAVNCGLGVHGVPMSRALSHRDVTSLLTTRRLAQDFGIDVLHGHGAKGGAVARLAAASLPVSARGGRRRPRTYYTPHGGSLHYDPHSAAGRIFLGLERRLERWTDGLIFESAFSAQAYAAKVGRPAVPVRVVPNGLRQAEFMAVIPEQAAADFVYVGELRHLKGVDVLLRALKTLDLGRPATAVIVGAGPDSQALQALARELDLDDHVRFAGPMPARAAFALGRTLVVPSRAEAFPYIVLEAAAAGVPLIATEVGGIPEILEGSGVGMVQADSVEALAGAMRAAVPSRSAAAAGTLRARVAERFTVARMTDAILGFYDERAPAAPALRLSRTGAG